MMEAAKSLILAWQMVAKRSPGPLGGCCFLSSSACSSPRPSSRAPSYTSTPSGTSLLRMASSSTHPPNWTWSFRRKRAPFRVRSTPPFRAIVDRETRVGVGWMLTDRLRVGSSPTFLPGKAGRGGAGRAGRCSDLLRLRPSARGADFPGTGGLVPNRPAVDLRRASRPR